MVHRYPQISKWCSGKETTCQCRRYKRWVSIPGSGRFPGGGHGNPLQYSCLENSMDRGAWQATVYGVARSRTRRSNTRTPMHPHTHTLSHSYTDSHTLTLTHTCTHTDTHTHTLTHILIHTHTHTHSHTLLHTLTHTHTESFSSGFRPSASILLPSK